MSVVISTNKAFQLTKFTFEDHNIFFAVQNPSDEVQKHHMMGRFYELEELDIIRQYFPKNGVWCDIGANFGNHLVFAGVILKASHLIAFEPNPGVVTNLIVNVHLNNLDPITDLSMLRKGLSSRNQTGLAMVSLHPNNIGSAKFLPEEGRGNLEVVVGDQMLEEKRVDFLKIDVEGMELDVLRGLEKTVSRCRPRMFVEVNNDNYDDFAQLMKDWDYRIAETFKRYEVNENFMVVPNEEG